MPPLKPLLNYAQLIKKLEDIGILFNIIDKPTARQILETRNYYYKLASYRKLFEKKRGCYDIEFAVLADLAVIDMQLRYYLLDLCLDVEHGIKTALMDAVTKNPNVDGYAIVKDYAAYNPLGYNSTRQALSRNQYLKKVYLKHNHSIPIWVLIEVMDFGNLCYLVEMYCQQFPTNKRLKKARNLCKFARHIRNACAHSNVLLVDVLDQPFAPSAEVVSYAERQHIKRDSLKYHKIHDIFCLVTLHQEYCSKELGQYRRKQAIKLAKRAKKHLDYYEKNDNIVKIYQNIGKILVKTAKK